LDAELTVAQRVALWTTMVRIRAFELKVEELFLAGRLPGFVHVYTGQEAIAAGLCAVLRPDDYLFSHHRGHGHAIAKGTAMASLMAELYGKRTGLCRGKGGSMHIADVAVGMMGANGVLTSGLVLAVGAALSAKMRRSGQVAVALFGDGASNRGPAHEAMNMAAAFKLPVVFLCENNQYASTTPVTYSTAGRIVDRAVGYAMPGYRVDGNDVEQVFAACREAVERAREQHQPSLIEAQTYRLAGHYVGDPQRYRERDEAEPWRARDPVLTYRRRLLEAGALTEADAVEIERRASEEVAAAVRFAEESPLPNAAEALDDVYAGVGVEP